MRNSLAAAASTQCLSYVKLDMIRRVAVVGYTAADAITVHDTVCVSCVRHLYLVCYTCRAIN